MKYLIIILRSIQFLCLAGMIGLTIWMLLLGFGYMEPERIEGHTIIRHKEIYYVSPFGSVSILVKWGQEKVGWASAPYIKTLGGETTEYDGFSLTSCSITFSTRDKYYYYQKEPKK